MHESSTDQLARHPAKYRNKCVVPAVVTCRAARQYTPCCDSTTIAFQTLPDFLSNQVTRYSLQPLIKAQNPEPAISCSKLTNPLDVPGPHHPRHYHPERVAVIAGQWLSVHLVGQQHLAPGIQRLTDGDARSKRVACRVEVQTFKLVT